MYEVISLAIMVALTVMTGAFILLLVVAIVFNVRAGERYRQKLAEKVDQLRLGRMLAALGVDTDSYVHGERVADIYQQMSRCSACENTDQCDDQLGKQSITPDNIGYCNNETSLKGMLDKRVEATTATQD